MAREGKRQFNIYLPPELVRRVKYASIDAGLSISAYVERAIRAQLEHDQPHPDSPHAERRD